MENTKKTFIAGLNTDDSNFAHTGEDNLDALNARVISSSEGKSGSLSNVNGTTKIPNYQVNQDTKVIGSYEDPTTNNIFYFLINKVTSKCAIYCYKPEFENIYLVLNDNDLESNYSLNFNKDKPITGIAYIDDILYWTGVEEREPFRINVERGIATNNLNYQTESSPYIQPIKKSVVTLIRKPPMLPLKTTVQEDSTRDTSFLKSRAHTFAYRYVYKDGETSVFSPTSHHYPNQDMDNENHKTSKKIKVDFPLYEADSTGISQDVHKIQFAVKFDKDTSYFIWKEFDSVSHATVFQGQKESTEGVITADFYNDVLGFSVDDSNSVKLYDTVPYEAEALSIARNRLFLGNIKEGRLNPKQIDSNDISLEIINQNFSDSFSQYDRNKGGKVGFAHSSAYQIGIAFYDFAGRTGGVLTDDSLKVITPERGLNLSNYNSVIRFNINQSLINKIPDWAEYYAIVRTKNLTKDFTISNLSDKIRYFETDSNGGFSVNVEKKYPVNDTNDIQALSGTPSGTFSDNEFISFSTNHEGIAIGLGDLTSYKQGYSYQEGDRIKLITSNKVSEFAIIGQEGKYVKTNLVNLNDVNYLGQTSLANIDHTIVYEIYSPHKIQPNEFYYECFNGRIIREEDNQPTLSNMSGDLIGDVYLRSLKADTSDLEPHFFSASARSENKYNDPFAGHSAYIGFPYYHGVGLNDLSANTGLGNFTYTNNDLRFEIKITSTSGSADQFQWRKRQANQRMINHAWGNTTTITGGVQTLSDGLTVQFNSTTGHTLNDKWAINCKTSGAGLGNVNSKTYSHYLSPPNGVIQAGSKVKVHHKEYQDKTWLAGGDEHHEWTVTMEQSEVTKNYATIEELFWESDFGEKICAVHNDGHIFFRRSTIDATGDNGKNKMYILDSEFNSNTPTQVSQSDGTLVNMIVKSDLTQNNDAEAKVDTNNDILVDLPDEYSYAAESMNPSTDYFLNWIQITGKPNLVPSEVSSQIKTTSIVFSETKIPGSKINGLSKFSALDEKRLDDATGPLRSLKVTSKTQSTGTVMLAISENETSSIYLGEQQLQQSSSGGQFLAVSSGVIGTINTLKGSYGTKHPESVAINEGSAFWFDVKNQTVVKYNTNGLTAIGDVKMKTYFKEKSDIITSDSLNSFVIGTYDDYNSEYILSLPKTGETVVVLQEDPYYPDEPVIDITNVSEEPTSKVVSVSITKPWNIINEMTVIDGVGTFNFTSPYTFTIPSNVVISPSGSTISVVNASSGGFSTNSDGEFLAGTGSLTISNVFGNVSVIQIQLAREIQSNTGDIIVSNVVNYQNDTSYLYGSQTDGNTPIRVTGASTGTFPMFEEKEISLSNGSATIACSSSVPWQFGNSNNNTTNFTECSLGVCSDISSSRIGTSATEIQESGSVVGYQPGSFNIVIQGITEDIDSVVMDSRPLKKAVISIVDFDNITSTGIELNSSISLNRETATEFGFVYSTTDTNPVIGASGVTKQVITGDITSMSHSITGLSSDTTVYSKTYLISNFGTRYSSVSSQSTGSSTNTAPTVVTGLYKSAQGVYNGSITSNGGSTAGTNGITQRGFVHSISDTTPTIGESGVTTITASQTSISSFPYNYQASVGLLAEGATYYWRAYAKNDIGTSYGTVYNHTVEDTSFGIGGFTLQSNSVNANGGYVQIDVSKSQTTGTASGQITIVMDSSNSIIESETVDVAFTNTQTIDSVQVYVPGNFIGGSRTINFKVTNFDGISNATGQSTPVSITGSVSQSSSQYQP